MNERRLLLFDIDGTLITTGGAGEGALKDAMAESFGVVEDFVGINLAGATDGIISRHLLAKHELPVTPENIATLLDTYLHHLVKRLPQHRGRVLPGIPELLLALKPRPDVVLALLTGNISRGAELKLTHHGVWHFFEFGAYADDHHDRNELGKFAKSRAEERHAHVFAPELIYVIGDTPRDIACGRAIGAKTVAVATGMYSHAELLTHEPDLLYEDLTKTDEVVAALLGK